MNKEIERKYYLSKAPDFLYSLDAKPIQQGYVAVEKGGNVVRVRRMGNAHLLTVKSPGAMERTEIEFQITESVFDALWGLTNGRRVEKNRYAFHDGGYTYEVDEYLGPLKGLFTVEIEFETVKQAEQFQAPVWVGVEVTSDHRFKNMNLATLDDLDRLIQEFSN